MHTADIVRVGQRFYLLLIGVGIWAGGAAALWAQLPGGPQTAGLPQAAEAAPKQPQFARCYVRKTQFNLPVNISELTRSSLSGIHLYCLNNASAKWVLLAKCPPTQTGFNFDAHGEGEFWFTLSMVDKQNHVVPADPSLSEYKMGVIVDVTPPTLEVQFLNTTSEGYVVQVDVRDAHPDPSKTTFEYQTLNKDWRALEPMGGDANRYCIPVQAAVTGMVRVRAADLAENAAVQEFDLVQMKKAARQIQETIPSDISGAAKNAKVPPPVAGTDRLAAAPGPMPATSQVPMPVPQQNPNPVVASAAAYAVPVPALRKEGFLTLPVEDVSEKVQVVNGAVIRPREKAPGLLNPVQAARATDIAPLGQTPPSRHGDEVMQRINRSPDANSDTAPEASPSSGKIVTVSASQPAPTGPLRKVINQRQLMLDYRLEHVGPSGVGKVEIWMTSDQSKSWQKLGEDVERKSPVTIELPGEGLYGITIVVSNGRGFGGAPPNAGEAPDTWVEVDMTRPIVEIKDVRPGGKDDPGTVHVTWNVQDKNLGPEPVDLYYSSSRDGSWSLIAKGLHNDGHYGWTPPASVGTQVYLRLVARDMAGNATVVETSQPFAVDDMSRPRGRLIGVVPVSPDVRLEPISN